MLLRWYRSFISNPSLEKYFQSIVKIVQGPLKLFKHCCHMEILMNQVAEFNEIVKGLDHLCRDIASAQIYLEFQLLLENSLRPAR